MRRRALYLCVVLYALTCSCTGGSSPVAVTTVTAPSSLGVDACPFSVPADQQNAVASPAGETRAIDIITGEACAWTAESQASFITVAPTSGRGSGRVTVTVAPNTGAARSGSVAVNQYTVTITQPGVPCRFALSPASQSFDASGGSGSVTVTVSEGVDCQWTATSNSSFLAVTSGSSGTGDGTVAFRVTSNSGEARGGTLTIAGLTFVVNQAALPPAPPPTSILSLGGFVQPWCNNPGTIVRSTPGPDYPSQSTPGSFTYPDRRIPTGTTVQLNAVGAGVESWSGCDSTTGSACTLTVNDNRTLSVSVGQSCSGPSFSNVSKVQVGPNWIISFTVVNSTPYASSNSLFEVTVDTSCSGLSVSSRSPSVASGTISGTLSVPAGICGNGTLTVTDFNGSGTAPW